MKILYTDYKDITKHVVLQDVMEHAVNKLKKEHDIPRCDSSAVSQTGANVQEEPAAHNVTVNKTMHCNVTMKRVRVATVAVDKQ